MHQYPTHPRLINLRNFMRKILRKVKIISCNTLSEHLRIIFQYINKVVQTNISCNTLSEHLRNIFEYNNKIVQTHGALFTTFFWNFYKVVYTQRIF